MMIEPALGPFLFDTSAQNWLARTQQPRAVAWMQDYLALYEVQVSSMTILERIRGYSLLWRRAHEAQRPVIEGLRIAFLNSPAQVWPVDATVAALAGEIMALIPDPPTRPKASHRQAESRAERLVRWRFDVIIAATALVARMPLIHNNAADFEPIRGAME